jgi:CubicO group peptidase (beta-lactamase class C family)
VTYGAAAGRVNAVVSVTLLTASITVAACAKRVQPDRAAGLAAHPPSSVHEAPPVGSYPLTDSISMVIERDTTSAPRWTVRIGEGAPHAMLGEGGWSVPALHLTLERGTRGGVGGLLVRRYGETVFVARDALPGELPGSTPQALAELTPRLMIALNVPGVGIALIRDGEIAWRGYFGVKRSGSDDRIDSLTVFEAASTSKPAYTYPFMKLVENGAIDLDTPLVRYLGRDYIPGDTLHRAITARMVLSHTTGFPNWRGDEGLTVEFQPGTQVGYSGEGFQFLQTVAEAVTGKPMAAFTRDALFDPLGLSRASYVWLDAYDSIAAFGHTSGGEPRAREPYTEANAAYTLYITPADYARLLIEIMQADRSAPHSLSATTRAAMLESQHVVPDREPIARRGQTGGEVHFALGWRFDRTASGDIYWHSGSNSTGFQCYAEFDLDTGDGIVVMTNSSSGSPLWRALMATVGSR